MILLDRRIGSSDLYQPLKSFGLDVHLTSLTSADAAWLGRGPDEEPVPVGVEIKRVGDLLTSITTGRLAGYQLPKLINEYRHAWLLIEGQYRSGAEGLLETKQGTVWAPHALGRSPWTYQEVERFLTTLEVRAGIHIRRAWNRQETAALIAAWYRWWTSKPYEDHKAHQAMYSPMLDSGLIYRPSLARRVAAELPGIGIGKSGAVADRFKTVRRLVGASEEEWQEVPGIGKTLAKRISDALEGK